jgi:hypothetical protein
MLFSEHVSMNKSFLEYCVDVNIIFWEYYLTRISNILIHLVCQSVTGLGKGVLCSYELSVVGRTVTTDSE